MPQQQEQKQPTEQEWIRFKNVVAMICLLGGPNILTKSPQYISEKFESFTGIHIRDLPATSDATYLLDGYNRSMYLAYLKEWRIE